MNTQLNERVRQTIMDMKKGTPKTLDEAVRNAVEVIVTLGGYADKELAAAVIKGHVKDFLAQRFSVEMMTDTTGSISRLWTLITGEEK